MNVQQADTVYDHELEELWLDEAECDLCESPAGWLHTNQPCGHSFKLCDRHHKLTERQLKAAIVVFFCVSCKADVTNTQTRRI